MGLRTANISVRGITAYPNPFEDAITFNYVLGKNELPSMLSIRDNNGQLVTVLPMAKNSTQASWKPQKLAAGVYTAILQTDKNSYSCKFIKI